MVEYDFHSRFHRPVEDFEWAVAARLVGVLVADPSSAIAAGLQGWDHPISREALIMLDQYDLNHQVAAGGKRVQPHPGRPTSHRSDRERYGDTGGRTPEQVMEILRAARDGYLG